MSPKLPTAESIGSEFAHACLFSVLFSFRAPFEALHLRRPFKNDRLGPPPRGEALAGIRTWEGREFLAAEMSSRKNPNLGVIAQRPCFCGLSADMDRLACPAHSFRPAIKARGPPGAQSPTVDNRRNFNRRLKATLDRIAAPPGFPLQLPRI